MPEELRSAADGASIAIWTTTPWTMPANMAVAVNGSLQYSLVQTQVRELVAMSSCQQRRPANCIQPSACSLLIFNFRMSLVNMQSRPKAAGSTRRCRLCWSAVWAFVLTLCCAVKCTLAQPQARMYLCRCDAQANRACEHANALVASSLEFSADVVFPVSSSCQLLSRGPGVSFCACRTGASCLWRRTWWTSLARSWATRRCSASAASQVRPYRLADSCCHGPPIRLTRAARPSV